MANKENTNENVSEPQAISFAEFLESAPPNQMHIIQDLTTEGTYGGTYQKVSEPDIQLHCPGESCNGPRFFRCTEENEIRLFEELKYFFLEYRCNNCLKEVKIFSLAAVLDAKQAGQGICFKLGERPVFGPPTPARLIKLVGPDRELFIRGRRCENQGLGVGAFAYYRRVIENQKNRIIGEIIRVSEKLDSSSAKIDVLKKALVETKFSKAHEMSKDAIPESLLIDGHSPLLLLHKALSKGIHEQSDEECLDKAHSIRIVLAELSDRLSQALKDDTELTKALSGLMNKGKD